MRTALSFEGSRSCFTRLMAEFQNHKDGIERPQQCNRTKSDRWHPQNKMKPKGQRYGHFKPVSERGDDRSDDEDHKDSRPIATILRAEIKFAFRAWFCDVQQVAKKSAGAASRAPVANYCRVTEMGCVGVLHSLAISHPTNRRRRKETAKRRQQNANTRLPLQSQSGGPV